jgi:hypothetical protein
MTAGLESNQQSKMDPLASSWKLTVTDRRLMWLQKRHLTLRAETSALGISPELLTFRALTCSDASL